MKRFCISINDWVYTKYLGNNINNRSRFIEEMFVKGVESELEVTESSKGKIVQLIQENRNKDNKILDLEKKILEKDSKIDILLGEIKKLKDKDDISNWKTVKIGE